jgi:integrase
MEVKLYKRGKVWWMRWNKNGKLYRESTKCTNKRLAESVCKNQQKLLFRAEGVEGAENLTLRDLVQTVIDDYMLNRKRSLDRIVYARQNIERHMNMRMRLLNFTSKDYEDYASYRVHIENAAAATVNRELSVIRRGYNLLKQSNRISDIPYIKMLDENNARQGFFTPEEFQKLVNELPWYLKQPALLAYRTGWRKEEIFNLTWNMVDIEEGVIRLSPELSKNKEGRTYYLDKDLLKILKSKKKVYEQWKEEGMIETDYVFTNRTLTDKIRDARGAFAGACKRAKLDKKFWHDFRRSFASNMTRAGVPEKVTMQLGGWKTNSTFKRYNIVSDEDLKVAVAKQREYLNNKVED